MMEDSAEKALLINPAREGGHQTTAKYLSGVTVTHPLIAAVIKWDSEDTLDATKRILECTKTLIDNVSENITSSPEWMNSQIIELCIYTVASNWSQCGECDPKVWAQPLAEIVRNVVHNPNRAVNKSFSGFASVLCALSSRGIQRNESEPFQSICAEISGLCESALSKVIIVAGPNKDSDSEVFSALHGAACNLFISTLEHEYREHLNNSYRSSIDPDHKQIPFDIGILLRRYRLYFSNLCEALYANSRHG